MHDKAAKWRPVDVDAKNQVSSPMRWIFEMARTLSMAKRFSNSLACMTNDEPEGGGNAYLGDNVREHFSLFELLVEPVPVRYSENAVVAVGNVSLLDQTKINMQRCQDNHFVGTKQKGPPQWFWSIKQRKHLKMVRILTFHSEYVS